MILLQDLRKEPKQLVKKIIKKYRNLGKKKAPKTTFNDIADAETIDYNNDANISDLNKTPIKKSQVHKQPQKKLYRNTKIYQRKKHLFLLI